MNGINDPSGGLKSVAKNTEIQFKVGAGKTFGASLKTGPLKFEKYRDNGTYSTGYNTKEGLIYERTTGKGGQFGPFGSSSDVTEVSKFDGWANSTGADMVKIESETSGIEVAGMVSKETATSTPYSLELPNMSDFPCTGMSCDSWNMLEWQQENTTETQSGQPTTSEETSISFGFDLRLFKS